MRTRIGSGMCVAIAFGFSVGLLAQAPQGASPQAPQGVSQAPQGALQAPQSSSAKSITVTGCVERAAEAPAGTSGTATARASEAKFTLTNAAMSATGTAGAAGTARTASEYRLDADDAKLTPHVGHKVEITGTVDGPANAAAPSQAPGAGASASAANSPKLKVDMVKMIASACP